MMLSYTDAPQNLTVLLCLLLAGFITVMLALRAAGHRLDTATHGRSYFWGYLVGFHYVTHYSVTLAANLAFMNRFSQTEIALLSGITALKIILGLGLIARLREAWCLAGLLFAAEWLISRSASLDMAGLALMFANLLYLRRRWRELYRLLPRLRPRRMETTLP